MWPKTIAKILDYIHQHFSQRILLRDVAAHVGMSVNYMNEQFKAEVGTTLADYVNRYRIQQAVHLLTSTDMKVYQVAEAVGIPDYKYFSRVFKRYVGHAPTTVSQNRTWDRRASIQALNDDKTIKTWILTARIIGQRPPTS